MTIEQVRTGRWIGRAQRILLVVASVGVLGGCSAQSLLLKGVADELATQGNAAEDDLALAREASAFYLKLSESLLSRSPDHLALAEAVAGGFTRYAYAFVAVDAERIESSNPKAAQQQRQRAARLYWRAHRHAMAALERHTPGFASALVETAATQNTPPAQLGAEQVGLAYWAAAAWGAYISLSKDKPDAVADLPQAMRLARLAWEHNPAHGDGALATLMGTFEAARPGGSSRQAEAYFNRAIDASAGLSAGPYVAKAEALALPAGDRASFESLLRQALNASTTRRDLPNEVMRERAQWLLDTAADRF